MQVTNEEVDHLSPQAHITRKLNLTARKFGIDDINTKPVNCPSTTFDDRDRLRIVDKAIKVKVKHRKGTFEYMRPDCSYVALISIVLEESEEKMLTLRNIYSAIMDKWPFYKYSKQNWKNSIRHNLSLQDCFIKTDKHGCSADKKGNFWRLADGKKVKDMFEGENYKRRKREKKSGRIGGHFQYGNPHQSHNFGLPLHDLSLGGPSSLTTYRPTDYSYQLQMSGLNPYMFSNFTPTHYASPSLPTYADLPIHDGCSFGSDITQCYTPYYQNTGDIYADSINYSQTYLSPKLSNAYSQTYTTSPKSTNAYSFTRINCTKSEQEEEGDIDLCTEHWNSVPRDLTLRPRNHPLDDYNTISEVTPVITTSEQCGNQNLTYKQLCDYNSAGIGTSGEIVVTSENLYG